MKSSEQFNEQELDLGIDLLNKGMTITTAIVDVSDNNGKIVGSIKQIIGDKRNSIEYAIFQFKIALGLGRKMYLIPWEKLVNHPSGGHLLLEHDLEFIRNAPSFYDNDWPDDINFYLSQVSQYWN